MALLGEVCQLLQCRGAAVVLDASHCIAGHDTPVRCVTVAAAGHMMLEEGRSYLEEFLRFHVRAFDQHDDVLAAACTTALAASTTSRDPTLLAIHSEHDGGGLLNQHPPPPSLYTAAQRLVSLLPVRCIDTVASVEGYVQVLSWLTQGYHADALHAPPRAVVNGIPLTITIPFTSLCEHHMLPFHGTVRIVIAGSPLSERDAAYIVHRRARRLQVQERLTNHIADDVVAALGGVQCVVLCEALHLCMAARGVGKHASRTVTTAVRGVESGRQRLALLALLD